MDNFFIDRLKRYDEIKEEKVFFRTEKDRREENDLNQQKIENLKILIKEISKFANRIFWFVCGFCIAVLLIVVAG